MRFELFLARRYLRGRSRRFVSGITAIATGGVFVGVAAIIIVLSVQNGFHKELRERILGSTPHVLVSRFGYQPVPYAGDGDSVLAKIRRVPGVIDAAPFILFKTLVRAGRAVEGAVVSGVEAERERQMTGLAGCIVEGEFNFDSGGVVLGRELARTLGVSVGDHLALASPFGGTSTPLGLVPRARGFRVNGIFDSGMYEVDAGTILAGLADLQVFLNLRGQVSGFEVRVKNVDAAGSVARRISRELGFPFRATDWIAKNRNLFTALKLEKVVTFIVLVLIVLVAAFNIIGMLTMMVMRKTREIGILKTIGARPGVVTRVFMLAGFLIGGVGTGLGALFGFVASLLLNKYRFVQLPGDVYFIRNLPVQMQWLDFAVVCGAAVVITFLAAVYPAYKAARLQPVDAIRYE
ncbi:lipoprotein-releasing ABC transporter permease subunit [candidate division WOR-3 bacterium]|nr:lipoprotein-releasing ABC transporter permease subunit [candidate division WOR-3 bacterium]